MAPYFSLTTFLISSAVALVTSFIYSLIRMYNVGDPDYIGQGEYMKPETMEAVLKALADRTRLRILGLLATGEVCVCHLHESLQAPSANGVEAPGLPEASRSRLG